MGNFQKLYTFKNYQKEGLRIKANRWTEIQKKQTEIWKKRNRNKNKDDREKSETTGREMDNSRRKVRILGFDENKKKQ